MSTKDDLTKLARECGATTYTNRHFPLATAFAFSPLTWEKFCEALVEQPAQQQEPWVCECKADSIQICKCTFKAQPNEPVAYIDMREWPPIRWRDGLVRADVATFDGQGLFFAPPASKPLTDEQIERIYTRYGGDMMNCARAIERAHGIKGDA